MKKRLQVSFGVITVVSLVLAITFSTLVMYRAFTAHIYSDLRTTLHMMVETGELDLMVRRNHKSDAQSFRVTMMDLSGNVLYDNAFDASQVENQRKESEVSAAITTGEGFKKGPGTNMQETLYWYAMIRRENGTVLRIGRRASSIWQMFLESSKLLLFAGIGLLLICLALGKYLTHKTVLPIKLLADNPENTGEGKIYPELQPFVTKIQQKQEQITRTARMQERFTANITHELKTPLAAISGYAQFLESGDNSSEEQQHFGKEIGESAERLLDMVDDILSLSKLDAKKETPIEKELLNLNDLVSFCVSTRETKAALNQIQIHLDQKDTFVEGNRAMLRQMINNLIDNAITYGRTGGNVWIRIDNLGNGPFFEIKDDGIGIPKEDLEHVFERFYRVEKNETSDRKGNGLGLSIVKEIAGLHQATIQLESEPEVGTIILVQFPKRVLEGE
ncbi:MAG: HAMP domain-containing histidine kinase [Lachnospiraceae bacterium]|nr:HAMP domain-containing histidine kinase [Lachnospiraceae bacterium]